MLIKLIYLVRNELTLIILKSCSLSREIGFPDRARIIEFGSKVMGAGLRYLVVAFCASKVKVTCHNVHLSKTEGYKC